MCKISRFTTLFGTFFSICCRSQVINKKLFLAMIFSFAILEVNSTSRRMRNFIELLNVALKKDVCGGFYKKSIYKRPQWWLRYQPTGIFILPCAFITCNPVSICTYTRLELLICYFYHELYLRCICAISLPLYILTLS